MHVHQIEDVLFVSSPLVVSFAHRLQTPDPILKNKKWVGVFFVFQKDQNRTQSIGTILNFHCIRNAQHILGGYLVLFLSHKVHCWRAPPFFFGVFSLQQNTFVLDEQHSLALFVCACRTELPVVVFFVYRRKQTDYFGRAPIVSAAPDFACWRTAVFALHSFRFNSQSSLSCVFALLSLLRSASLAVCLLSLALCYVCFNGLCFG